MSEQFSLSRVSEQTIILSDLSQKIKLVFVFSLAFSNHFHHYYIYGEFPTCEIEKNNIKTCFKNIAIDPLAKYTLTRLTLT